MSVTVEPVKQRLFDANLGSNPVALLRRLQLLDPENRVGDATGGAIEVAVRSRESTFGVVADRVVGERVQNRHRPVATECEQSPVVFRASVRRRSVEEA